jgi:hypothetical protein
MRNKFYHNYKSVIEDSDKKILNQINNRNPKILVDINKLLNRVKINKKKETKDKLIFLGIVVLFLGIVGIFIVLIN